MKSVVIDTSALMRLYIPDGPLPPGLEGTIGEAWKGNVLLVAPDLVLAEVAQVLRKKELSAVITPDESDEILQAILEIPLHVVGHRSLLTSAVDMARRLNLTVYDGLFLALARLRGAELITADEELDRKFKSE